MIIMPKGEIIFFSWHKYFTLKFKKLNVKCRFFEDFLTETFSDENLAMYLLKIENLLFDSNGNSNIIEETQESVFIGFLKNLIQTIMPG